METDQQFRDYRKHQDRFHKRLDEIRAQTDILLKEVESSPTAANIERLHDARGELDRLFQDSLKQIGSLIDYVRKIEESNRRKAAMVEKRSSVPRNQAQIQKLSEELTTNLRLERVDGAIKKLLDFLGDADFFAANASTGRRRRLRTLQNAIENALKK